MSLFLFKPHVVGPKGDITTPDIIVDRLYVDGKLKSLNSLSSETYQLIEPGETCRPAYAITAAGAGALISPATLIGLSRICIARKSWRLQNLNGHTGTVTLNGIKLETLRLPSDLIEATGGSGDTMPRGYLLICSSSEESTEAILNDQKRGRKLVNRMSLSSVEDDPWGGKRPNSRYSVGPMIKEVEHYY